MTFVKTVGSGNDFIIIDNRSEEISDPVRLAKDLCRRRLSIGADGLLLLCNATQKVNQAHFRMRIFNPDGSEAEMCGNGLRCFLLYLVKKGLATEGQFVTVETAAGLRRGKVEGNLVSISLGKPQHLKLFFTLKINERETTAGFVNTGVPHTVIEVSGLSTFPVKEWGQKVRFHPQFSPAGTNVDFVEIRKGEVFLRTYERGVEDETLACGTGAAAAGFILSKLKRVTLPVKIHTASGEILVVTEKAEELFLSGEARIVYEGSLVN